MNAIGTLCSVAGVSSMLAPDLSNNEAFLRCCLASLSSDNQYRVADAALALGGLVMKTEKDSLMYTAVMQVGSTPSLLFRFFWIDATLYIKCASTQYITEP
jgi:hypothetical protein